MSHTLLIIAIGPVQQFIGQARRTRDLWFGSHILSEMSRAVALSLAESGWTLVFPALTAGHPELEPCDGTIRPETGASPLGIANKILATRLGAGDSLVTEAASDGRNAAIEVWERFAEKATERAKDLLAPDLGVHESPEAVVDSFLEVIAGWSRYDADGDFETARSQAEEAIAARKTLRDFRQWKGGPFRKSSLDGQRESILADRQGNERLPELARQFRIGDREHLDAIGLVKRAGGAPDQFVPVARVAIDPWLRELDEAARRHPPLERTLVILESKCREQSIPRSRRGATRWLRGGFPYDGEIFFEGQWPALKEELGLDDFFGQYVRRLFRTHLSIPEPHPYVACLHADGDRMGKVLRSLGTAEKQSKLSRALADFSKGVRDIVENYSGLSIYAGGDDVVAILPVAHAVPCAEALRAAFVGRMRAAFADVAQEPDATIPTLSVGIAIAHFLTPLGRLLELSRLAEAYAKQGDKLPEDDPRKRNALGVIVDKRSGDTIEWRGQWPVDPPSNEAQPELTPGERLARLVTLLGERRMPGKLPYELDQLVRDIDREIRQTKIANDLISGRIWRLEALRILTRKRSEGANGPLTPDDIDLHLPSREDARLDKVREALVDWVCAAKIAHAIADAEGNCQRVEKRGIALEGRDDD
jgi:CRISPR-associated protein Cmr2